MRGVRGPLRGVEGPRRHREAIAVRHRGGRRHPVPLGDRRCARPARSRRTAGRAHRPALTRVDTGTEATGPVRPRRRGTRRGRARRGSSVRGSPRAPRWSCSRCPSAELLGRLEPERLRALCVVGPHVHVHEGPRQSIGEFYAEARSSPPCSGARPARRRWTRRPARFARSVTNPMPPCTSKGMGRPPGARSS